MKRNKLLYKLFWAAPMMPHSYKSDQVPEPSIKPIYKIGDNEPTTDVELAKEQLTKRNAIPYIGACGLSDFAINLQEWQEAFSLYRQRLQYHWAAEWAKEICVKLFDEPLENKSDRLSKVLTEYLTEMSKYWNGDNNQQATFDACKHLTELTNEALKFVDKWHNG